MPGARFHASVLIPTRNRATSLARAVAALAAQQPADITTSFEVVVGIDGEDSETVTALAGLASRFRHLRLNVEPCARTGIAAVKNRMIERATGSLLIFLNDDVIPAADFVARHVAAHTAAEKTASAPSSPTGSTVAASTSAGSRAPAPQVRMILGDSPYLLPPRAEQTFFDALISRTSMVFFYDQMPGARLAVTTQEVDELLAAPSRPQPGVAAAAAAPDDDDRDWGYRHAWNLNLSVPREAVLEVGGFRPAVANCCFEDVELAYRLTERFDAPVLFRPGAVAVHDHRMSPADYLDREFRLGYAAWGFALAAPECAASVFGFDLTARDAIDYARTFVAIEGRREPASRAAFSALSEWPADAQVVTAAARTATADSDFGGDAKDGPDPRLMRLAYEQHLPLKRLIFRQGLLEAAAGRRRADFYHPDHHPHLSFEPDAGRPGVR